MKKLPSFNQTIAFLVGLFFSAITFAFLLKILLSNGIYLGLIISFLIILFIRRQKHYQNKLLKAFTWGLLVFNIITIIVGTLIMILLLTAGQNLLN